MDDKTIEDITDAERELLVDFVEWLGGFDRQILSRQTIDGDSEMADFKKVFELSAPLVSEDASEFDAQMFQLFRLEQEIQSGPVFKYENEDDLPEDAEITPDKLNRFLRKDELERFFTLSAQMIETLTVELVMEEVVADSRQSKSVRQNITRKSQQEREWLLYVTGVISDGEKGEIRRAYDLRSSIVHSSENTLDLLDEVNVPSDVSRTKNAINSLHESLHGIELKHRFGDLIA